MLQYVLKYTKWTNIAEGFAKFHVNNIFCWTKIKTQRQQNKNASKIFLPEQRMNWTRVHLHRNLERYLSVTESTERIDGSQGYLTVSKQWVET